MTIIDEWLHRARGTAMLDLNRAKWAVEGTSYRVHSVKDAEHFSQGSSGNCSGFLGKCLAHD
jgi:hypothetical protein